jgi:hypothetical protein
LLLSHEEEKEAHEAPLKKNTKKKNTKKKNTKKKKMIMQPTKSCALSNRPADCGPQACFRALFCAGVSQFQ